eukprot:COSAG05_NODE_866_length_6876_cov_11.223255_2_plen_218_part_00
MNRKTEYRKQKKREGGGGRRGGDDGDGKRTGDGKPVAVKGMTFQKQVPKFVAQMMARDAAKQKAAAPQKVDLSQVLPTLMDRATKGATQEQWPSRGREVAAEPTREERLRDETEGETAVREAAERVARERADFIVEQQRAAREARQREEEQRYKAGHGVKAAEGQVRVIFAASRKRATDTAADGDSEVAEGQKKKKKKAKKKTANTTLLSFAGDDDE